jgi:excisionase family DNA binding protein
MATMEIIGTDRLALRPREVAKAVGVSQSKVYELIAKGEIPSCRIGRCVRVPLDSLKEYINRSLKSAAQ